MKIFKNLRNNRNENLLTIIGYVAKAEKPLSAYSLRETLGAPRAYSNVLKNVTYLETRKFLVILRQEKIRRKKLFDISVKGALASLFVSFPKLDYRKLLGKWRSKDWGVGYGHVFENISDVSELKKLVETLYLYGTSLEDVSEDLLKRGLRNPKDALSIINDATVGVEKKIGEGGKYEAKWVYVPGAVVTQLVSRHDGSKNVAFVVMPDEATSKVLFDSFSRDQGKKREIEASLLTLLQAIAIDSEKKGEGATSSYYLQRQRTFVFVGTIPERVTSVLSRPEQILDLTRYSYQDVIRPFLESEKFRLGNKYFIHRGFRYDPVGKALSLLSRNEIKEEARSLLEKMSKEP